MLVLCHPDLGVLGKVEDNWSRTSGVGDVKGSRYSPGDVLRPADLIVPLGDRPGKTQYVSLLEGVGAKEVSADLSGNHDYWS